MSFFQRVFLSLRNSVFELKPGGGAYTGDGPRRCCAAGTDRRERSIASSTLDGPTEAEREPHLHAALQKQRF